MRLSVLVKREQALDSGAWVWTALPQGYPGSAGGRTIAELHEEVEALKHFFTGEDPATDCLLPRAALTSRWTLQAVAVGSQLRRAHLGSVDRQSASQAASAVVAAPSGRCWRHP